MLNKRAVPKNLLAALMLWRSRKFWSFGGMMKTAICCPVFFLFFFVFQINFYSIPLKIPGLKFYDPITAVKQEPLLPLTMQSLEARQINCDRSHKLYDLCTINGPNVLDPTTSTFYAVSPTSSNPWPHIHEKIRPYPRKWENFTMKKIKELNLIAGGPSSPPCEVQHGSPALLFSAGGYTGNFFHEFNDGFIPLFITVNSVFSDDQDLILVISKARDWWVNKYTDLLRTFSKHPIITLDNETLTHCFPSATIGLMSHGFMTINPKLVPNSKTFTHFRTFLYKAYGRGQNHRAKSNSPKSRPRLVLASRSGGAGRVILNQNEVKMLAQDIGFDVTTFEPTPKTPLREAYELINSSHAMVGVHGAGLTHSLFLRPGAVLVQVVPLGAGWVAEACFANSARAMGLKYMEYKIGAEESSLADKYGRDSLLVKDPVAFRGKDWSSAVMDIYLKEQNVSLDLGRFGEYLKRAYKASEKFMSKNG